VSLVNGRVSPTLLARAGVPQRWRIVNASRAKYQRIQLPGHQFVQVGVDGGLLDAPINDAVITLPPGARADVVFAPRTTNTIPVDNIGVDHFHLNRPPKVETLFNVDVADDAPIDSPAIELPGVSAVDVENAVEQEVILNTALADDGNTYFAINGELGPDVEPYMASANTTEVWTLRNTTNQDHPFHLHGFFFQVLDVDGVPPDTLGWLDTINLEPQRVVRIAISFDDRAGDWMFHCHILDHSDAGMMRMLMVMP
jgi:FtsP/CotA-like multicopper oxidase with cupredoxin domain